MDEGTFDRLTRLLAGRLTRRTGLAASLGALAAGAGGSAPVLEARRRDRDRDRRRPDRAAGQADGAGVIDEKKPCGPKARDNRCRKHGQCCTKYCRKPKAGQKYGRCRCIKPGKKCKDGQTCCGGALCQDKTCTLQPTPEGCGAAGGACTADANCCTGLLCKNGTCAACGAAGGACTDDASCCSGLVCISGACGACVPSVCASGCEYTSVNAAYAAAAAGDTIYIGPGTYPTGIFITKDITLAGCPGDTLPKLVPDRVTPTSCNAFPTLYSILSEDPTNTTTLYTATLRNLVLEPTVAGSPDEAMVSSATNETVSYHLHNCTVNDARVGVLVGTGSHVAVDCTFDRCANGIWAEYNNSTRAMSLDVTGTSFLNSIINATRTVYSIEWDSSGTDTGRVAITDCIFSDAADEAMIFAGDTYDQANHVVTITNTTVVRQKKGVITVSGMTMSVTGCTIEDNKDSGIEATDTLLTVTNTSIKNNTGEYDVGGIYIGAEYVNASLTLAGSTMITGNTSGNALYDGGVLVYESGGFTVARTGTSTTNITNNTPDNCMLWVDPPDTYQTVSCSTWT